MKTFKEFLETSVFDDKNKPSAMRLVGDAGKDLALDALAGLIPGGSIAKSIFAAALNQRKQAYQSIQKDAVLSKAKAIIMTRISQKAQNRAGNIDSIVESYIGASDESQIYLSEQERKLVMDEIIKAVNNNTIKSGFAQELVNNILQQKISNIQSAISSSQPKRLVV